MICKNKTRENNTSQTTQCMQTCTRGCRKAINTKLEQNNTPFVFSFSQRSSEGRIGHPSTLGKNSRGSCNTATLSQAVPVWLRPLSNIIPTSYFNWAWMRVLWNWLLFALWEVKKIKKHGSNSYMQKPRARFRSTLKFLQSNAEVRLKKDLQTEILTNFLNTVAVRVTV